MGVWCLRALNVLHAMSVMRAGLGPGVWHWTEHCWVAFCTVRLLSSSFPSVKAVCTRAPLAIISQKASNSTETLGYVMLVGVAPRQSPQLFQPCGLVPLAAARAACEALCVHLLMPHWQLQGVWPPLRPLVDRTVWLTT